MIDSSGNTINTPSQNTDLNFILKEINFYIKHFVSAPSPDQTCAISEKIFEFLDASGDYNEIAKPLEILEEYAKSNKNQNVFLDLTTIRKRFMDSNIDFKKNSEAIKQYREYIYNISPNLRNNCNRVLIRGSIISRLFASNKEFDKEYAIQTSKEAEELLSKIHKSYEDDYCYTFKHFYLTKKSVLEKTGAPAEEILECTRTLALFLFEAYKKKRDVAILTDLLRHYLNYINNPAFPVEEQEKTARQIYRWAKVTDNKKSLSFILNKEYFCTAYIKRYKN